VLGQGRRQPRAELPVDRRAASEAGHVERGATGDGLTEQRQGRQHDGEPRVLVRRRRALARGGDAAGVGELGDGLPPRARLIGRERVVPAEHEPRHEPRMALVEEHLEHALEQHRAAIFTARWLARERLGEIVLQRANGALDDGVHEAFAAAEVVQDGGVRDPDLGGDLLETDRAGAGLAHPGLGRVEDRLAHSAGGGSGPSGLRACHARS
jgi:hypothetical protein